MDHSGSWSAYSQHYPCLSGGVNTAANPLPQPSQLNDLSLSSSLPRQEPVSGYGGTGPSLLLPVHHGLNVSQGGSHSDANFVNSNLLSTTYDSMLSTFPPPTKGHLGALNLPPGSALFKTLSKETEINELRGGFSRRSGLPPGAIPSDSNVAMSGGSTSASPGLFNAQTSPHSWRSSEIVPTSSSPFGVLPHKSVMQRSNSETPPNKAHSQVGKSSRNIIETNRFSETDLNFRNVLPVHTPGSNVLESSPNTPRPPLMMTQSEGLPTTPDNLSLTAMKPDFVAFHSNGSDINNPRSTLLNQSYISHGQFSSIEMHNEKRNVFSSETVSSTCKTNAFNSAAKNIPCSDMFGNSLPSSTSNNAPLPAHNSTRSHNNSATGGNAQLSPRNVGPPTSTSSQSQPRDLSSYSAYSATPTIPTNSQSFLANQMPSPSSLNVNHGMNFSSTGSQQAGVQQTSHEQHGHFSSIVSKPSSASTSVIVSDNEVTNVAYSSVITRANISSQVNTGYNEPMMLSLVKNMDDPKGVPASSDHLAHSLPIDPSLKLHDVPYNHMVKSNSNVNSDNCISDVNQTSGVVTDIPTNLSCSSKQMLPSNIASEMLSPQASSPLEISSNDQQRSLTPKNLGVESMFAGQGISYQHMDSISDNKITMSAGNTILLHSRHSPEMSDSNQRSMPSSRHEMKKRRRKRRKYYHHSRPESPPDMMVQITPMTPVSANKLSHKMAPMPHSVPLHHPPVSSPLAPIDLSSNDMMEPLHHLQSVGNMSQMNVTSPMDIVHNGTSNNYNNDMIVINSVESVLTPLPNVSPREINQLSPPQLPATPVHTPATNCTSTTSLDNSPRPKKSLPSIEDDLGFLAELPPVCNVAVQQIKRVPYKSYTKNAFKMNPNNGGFLESFMKFVKGDVPPPLNSPSQRKRGRGRGRASNIDYMSRMECYARTGGSNVELNPSTGLFVSRETPTPPDKDIEKSSDNVMLDNCLNDEMKLLQEGMKGKSTEKIAQEIIVPNPEAPKFSSDEEFSPLSLDTVTKSTIHGLSDMENGANKTDSKEKSNADLKTEVSPIEKNENRHELKIKVIGLRSGNLQTAQKARFCQRQRRRRRQRSSSKNSGNSSPKYQNSDASDEEFDTDETLMDGHDNNHMLEKKNAPKFPPRQLSMRKCKEKVIQKRQEKIEKRRQQHIAVELTNTDEFNDILDSDSDKDGSLYNSDTDPAWTPIRRDGQRHNRLPSLDDDSRQKHAYRSRKRQKFARRKRTKNKRSRSEGDWGIMQRNLINTTVPTYNECAVPVQEPISQLEESKRSVEEEEEEEEERKVGDFVIAKSDLMKDIHPIWRIDRQNLLQKFEPFIKEGQTLYRKTSTFAGWVPANKSQYQGIDVNILVNEHNNVIVECIKARPVLEQNSIPSTVEIKPQIEILDLNHQKESFEVYIQTLISQALDPNFIPEIIKEQDEYFLSNIREIDLVVTKCKNSILNLADWTENLRHCIECFPDLNLTSEDDDFLGVESNCQACSLKPCMQKMTFSGQPYNSVTLLYQKDISDIKEKEFHVCSGCSEIILLYNQIYHQKFRLYTLCSSKVKDIQQMDQNKESHVILEFCLEDAAWINKLFDDTLNIWRKCLRYRR